MFIDELLRQTLHELRPCFLVAFVQDPSLPIELVRETDDFALASAAQDRPHLFCLKTVGTQNTRRDQNLYRFWSLRYAIGHMSSVNKFETNLTANISVFDPPSGIDPSDLHVLLCSNPTRDLFFSGQEARRIADYFESQFSQENSDQFPTGKDIGDLEHQSENLIHLDHENIREKNKPTRKNLIAALRQGYDIVHYSGHAFFDNVLPGRSGLVLSGGVLTASDVRFMLDFNRNPIIYANACLAGRIKSISSRFTGLATAFIRAGAAGYISPLWSIDDRDAAALAQAFYDRLLNDRLPIGQCLQAAKWTQAKSGSITWASYVLYGDPALSIMYSGDQISTKPKEDIK